MADADVSSCLGRASRPLLDWIHGDHRYRNVTSTRAVAETQAPTPIEMGVTIAAQLERFITERLGPRASPRVGSVQRIGTGRSRENWLFELSWSDPTGERSESLIARRDPDGGLLETDRATEFAVLQALEGTGVPSRQARWLDADGAMLGKSSLVMVRLTGTCEYYLINGDRPEAERVDIARRFCDLLASVHQVDWRRAGFDQFMVDPGADGARHELSEWQSVLERCSTMDASQRRWDESETRSSSTRSSAHGRRSSTGGR